MDKLLSKENYDGLAMKAYSALSADKVLADVVEKNGRLQEALEKIDWYLQISDNHPMIQKNVQKCRRIIAETLQKESET